jgi:hypothetical protein
MEPFPQLCGIRGSLSANDFAVVWGKRNTPTRAFANSPTLISQGEHAIARDSPGFYGAFTPSSPSHDIHSQAIDPLLTLDPFTDDFQFPDFNTLPPVLNTADSVQTLPAITPTTYTPLDISLGPITPASATGTKRKMTESKAGFEEKTRFAAEEDKRRRNTAASARFRVKKKQREQALEKTSKEMQDRANALEKRVQELEMENRWLKGLITEKNGGKSVSELWAKFIADGGEKGLKQAAADFLKI